MNLVLILDDVAVVVVIVFLGEFQSRLKAICDLICVDIMVQGIRAYSPTTTITEPPLKSIGNVVLVFQSSFDFPRVTALYAE
jgi:hypothetical protein